MEKKNIATIKIVKEENYQVDINRLAYDMANYIDDALYVQFDHEECDEILANEMHKLALLNAVSKVWQEQFAQEIIDKKITSDKEIWG